jgi:hypothetical protein
MSKNNKEIMDGELVIKSKTEKNKDASIVGLALLRKDFDQSKIGKLPKPTKNQTEELRANRGLGIRCEKCGGWHHRGVVHLDYVGHAAVTDRLLEVDPKWNWEPVSYEENGMPKIINNTMWIKLTICGVTRLGYGDAELKYGKSTVIKEIIGDAIRNAAMRFGVGLNMWHKGELSSELGKQEETKKFEKIQKDAEADLKQRKAEKLKNMEGKKQAFINAVKTAKDNGEGINYEFGTKNDPLSIVFDSLVKIKEDGNDFWDDAISVYENAFVVKEEAF